MQLALIRTPAFVNAPRGPPVFTEVSRDMKNERSVHHQLEPGHKFYNAVSGLVTCGANLNPFLSLSLSLFSSYVVEDDER